MSDKKVQGVCIVVDSSIARASGPPEATHPTGKVCRDFLMRLKSVGHRLAWNKTIKLEWDKHQSRFATQWLVSMVSLRKVRSVPDTPIDEVREAIALLREEGVIAAMTKDAHLIEAALHSDRRISSLDDVARGHFGRLSAACQPLGSVVWVNPTHADETPLDWLENGARDEETRRLKPLEA